MFLFATYGANDFNAFLTSLILFYTTLKPMMCFWVVPRVVRIDVRYFAPRARLSVSEESSCIFFEKHVEQNVGHRAKSHTVKTQ